MYIGKLIELLFLMKCQNMNILLSKEKRCEVAIYATSHLF